MFQFRFMIVILIALVSATRPGAQTITLSTGATLKVFPVPQGTVSTGLAFIVCPGGGYNLITDGTEGTPPAQWLNQHGIAAFVLYYHTQSLHPIPLHDAQAALRYVRANAVHYAINPKKLGIMGFSAGGHLSATASVYYDTGTAQSTDTLARFSCRPDFTVLGYPVISMEDSITNASTKNNIIGADASQQMVDSLSLDKHVTANTPPAFLTHGDADQTVPIINSELYYNACLAHGVPTMFVIEKGKVHGYPPDPIDATDMYWKDSCLAWMQEIGLFSSSSAVAHPVLSIAGSSTIRTVEDLFRALETEEGRSVMVMNPVGQVVFRSLGPTPDGLRSGLAQLTPGIYYLETRYRGAQATMRLPLLIH